MDEAKLGQRVEVLLRAHQSPVRGQPASQPRVPQQVQQVLALEQTREQPQVEQEAQKELQDAVRARLRRALSQQAHVPQAREEPPAQVA